MLTIDSVRKGLRDVEGNFRRYILTHFREWRKWAEQSDRIYAGEEVKEDDVPPPFQTEMRVMKVIKEMETLGEFDWNNPTLRLLFAQMAESQFHRYFGGIIAELTIKMVKLSKASCLIEIGAGEGRLAELVCTRMKERNVRLPLFITDSRPIVEMAAMKLKEAYPEVSIEGLIWDITNPPSDALISRLTRPSIIYERYSLTYANCHAINNLARAADVLVLGGWFNHSGALYGFDKVFAKIGFKSLLFKDVEVRLRQYYSCILPLDEGVGREIDFPYTTILLAWR